MPMHALKEWAVTCAALGAGEQVVVLRKGGIHEKRFELPYRTFFLFPTFAHQRPDLVQPRWHDAYAQALDARDEPNQRSLGLLAELIEAHAITDSGFLPALGPFHVLSADYAAERLRWRRTQPLWVLVLRVFGVPNPPIITLRPEDARCNSWFELPESISSPVGLTPVIDDAMFAAKRAELAGALAGSSARPLDVAEEPVGASLESPG